MKGDRRSGPPAASRPWRRRSVVQWLGQASVLALSGDLLGACSGAAEHRTEPAGPSCEETDFAFEPGPSAVEGIESWPEATIDPQDLQSLLSSWRLTVDGLVEQVIELSFAELLAMPRQDQQTDLHCVRGWSVYDLPWHGVALSRLLELARPTAGATHMNLHAERGIYGDSLPVDVGYEPRSLLAYGVACHTLPLAHGFPLRVVVPRKYGYKNTKHLCRIELSDAPLEGHWVAWGYPADGDVPDSRLRPGKY